MGDLAIGFQTYHDKLGFKPKEQSPVLAGIFCFMSGCDPFLDGIQIFLRSKQGKKAVKQAANGSVASSRFGRYVSSESELEIKDVLLPGYPLFGAGKIQKREKPNVERKRYQS